MSLKRFFVCCLKTKKKHYNQHDIESCLNNTSTNSIIISQTFQEDINIPGSITSSDQSENMKKHVSITSRDQSESMKKYDSIGACVLQIYLMHENLDMTDDFTKLNALNHELSEAIKVMDEVQEKNKVVLRRMNINPRRVMRNNVIYNNFYYYNYRYNILEHITPNLQTDNNVDDQEVEMRNLSNEVIENSINNGIHAINLVKEKKTKLKEVSQQISENYNEMNKIMLCCQFYTCRKQLQVVLFN